MHEIKDEEVTRVKAARRFAAHAFEKSDEHRVLHLAMESNTYLPGIGLTEIRERFALTNTGLENAIRSLAGTLDQSAARQYVSDPSVPRLLAVDEVLGCDSGRKATWAHDLDSTLVLSNEYRARMPIVPM
jgi:hypothetical protein